MLRDVIDALENLEVMLSVIESFGDELPPACKSTCQEAWAIFDPFIAKYASNYDVCERSTRVIRLALNFFGTTALHVVPSMLSRMAAAFEATSYASYLWIIGKTIGRFGNEENPLIRNSFKQAFERSSTKAVSILQNTPPSQIPDGMYGLLNASRPRLQLTWR